MTTLPQPDASHFTVDPIAMWKNYYDTTKYEIGGIDGRYKHMIRRERVTKKDIITLQDKLNFPIPQHIVRFWKEVGAVDMVRNPTRTAWAGGNDFLNPNQIYKVIQNNSRFINAKKYDGHVLPFFWSDPDTFCIEVGGKRDGYITSLKNRSKVIATSFDNFLREMERDPGYYVGFSMSKTHRFYTCRFHNGKSMPDIAETLQSPIYKFYEDRST